MNGALEFDLLINNTQFKREFDEMQRRVMGFSAKAQESTSGIDASFRKLSIAAAGYFSFTQLKDLPMQLVKVRGEFQQLEVAFATMLGNKGKSDALMAEVVTLAATTPFDLQSVAQGAKQLLAYGVASEEISGTLTRLGDIAAGLSIPLNDLTYLYGTTKTQGRLFAQDLNQFVGRGIPLIKLLADQFKVAESEVKGLVEQGKVGFPEVEKAIKTLTDQGGMFSGLMEAQSKTLTGLASNLGDAYTQMLNNIGQSGEGLLSDVLKSGIGLVENYQKVLDVIEVLAITYGTYKAAVVIATIAQAIATASTQGYTAAQIIHYRALLLAEGAQKLLNMTMLANPYVAAVTVLVALASAVYLYSTRITHAEDIQNSFNEAMQEAGTEINTQVGGVQALTAQINDQNLSAEFRNKKLKELIALAPEHLNNLTLESMATKEGTAAIDAYIAAMSKKERLQTLEKEFGKSKQRELEAGRGENQIGIVDGIGILIGAGGNMAAMTSDYALTRSKVNIQAKQDEVELQKSISKQMAEVLSAEGEKQKAIAKTTDYYEEQIKSQKEQQAKSSTTREEHLRYEAEIVKLEQAKARITGGKQNKGAKSASKADEPEAGSYDYYQKLAAGAQQIIRKTSAKNTEELRKQQLLQTEYLAKAEEVRKQLVIRTYAEELEEKKKQYEQYQRWVDFVGKEQADAQFKALKDSGSTYYDYTVGEIARLNNLKEGPGLLESEGKILVLLNQERDALEGKKSEIESFREGMAKAKTEAQSLTEYLEVLRQKQAKLNDNTSEFGLEAKREVAEALVEGQRQQRKQLDAFLQQVNNSEAQRLVMTAQFGEMRAAIETRFVDKKSKEYQDAISELNKQEKQHTDSVTQRLFEESEAYKKLYLIVEQTGLRGTQIRMQRNREALDKLKELHGEETAEYKKLLQEKAALAKEFEQRQLDTVRMFAQLAGQLGDAIGQANGALGSTGQLISGIAGQMGNVMTSFDKTATDAEKVQAGIEGIIQIIGIVINSAKQRKEAEADYYRSTLAFQQQYNLLLNQQLGLQSQASGNLFVEDYVGKLTDGTAKLTDAQKNYQESLDKLASGKAKAGQKNGVDWGAVGQGAGAGAGAGAAIGALIGGPLAPVTAAIGAAIGGLVGGLTGLFAGKKKKDTFVGILEAYPGLIETAADGTEKLNTQLAQSLLASGQLDESTQQLVKNTLDWQKAMEEAQEQIKSVIKDLSGSLGNGVRDALVGAFEAGADSAVAFGDAVSKVIENVISQILFSQLFKKDFDQLQKEMEASYAQGGDQSFVDDLVKFYQTAGPKAQEFTEGLKAAQDMLEKEGLEIFKPSSGAATKGATNSLSGAIKSVTEETAGLIAGQMGAIRINGAEVLIQVKQSTMYLNEVARNTRNLETIERHLREIKDNDPLRSKGLTPK